MSTSPEIAEKQAGRGFKRIVYSQEDIQRRVAEMAGEITEAHRPEDNLLVLGLLKGSFVQLRERHPDQRRGEAPLRSGGLTARPKCYSGGGYYR
jgi:hypothetical protein